MFIPQDMVHGPVVDSGRVPCFRVCTVLRPHEASAIAFLRCRWSNA